MTAHKCMGHTIIFQYSIGLSRTYDPMIGEKVAFLMFQIWPNMKNWFQLIEKYLEEENINTLERVFLVKNNP